MGTTYQVDSDVGVNVRDAPNGNKLEDRGYGRPARRSALFPQHVSGRGWGCQPLWHLARLGHGADVGLPRLPVRGRAARGGSDERPHGLLGGTLARQPATARFGVRRLGRVPHVPPVPKVHTVE
jgi:hypothetical protein